MRRKKEKEVEKGVNAGDVGRREEKRREEREEVKEGGG